jgi:zinc transporter ZupT
MQIEALDLAPVLIGVIAGFVAAIALFQIALLRAVVLTVAAAAIFVVYMHGGVPELIADAHKILFHLEHDRNFWAGVLAGKLVAGLIIWPLSRRRA